MQTINSYEEYIQAVFKRDKALDTGDADGEENPLTTFNALNNAIQEYEQQQARHEFRDLPVPLSAALREDEAMALAQLVKRISWSDARKLAASDDEAYLMMDAVGRVMRALAESGYAPR